MYNLPGTKKVRGNENPDPSWDMTGEIVSTSQGGKPVYVERVKNVRKVVKLDNAGNEIWMKTPAGQPVKPVTELVQDPEKPFVSQEFILWDLGNGITTKNYHFRPDPNEKKNRPATTVDVESLLAEIASMRNELAKVSANDTAITFDGAVEDSDPIDAELANDSKALKTKKKAKK